MGVFFAMIALVAWGVGDFLIQRSTRKFGVVLALFIISAFGTIVFLPFVWHEAVSMFYHPDVRLGLLLVGTTTLTLIAALFDFQALRTGLLSTIEPILTLEVIVTTILGAAIIHEVPSVAQIFLILLVCLGILLVSIRRWGHIRLEPGVWYALLATIGLGGVNFMFGVAARATSPLMINWVTSFGLSVAMLIVLTRRREWSNVKTILQRAPTTALGVAFFDNIAWVAFAYATLTIPIAVANGISESYIALAVTLGLIFNRERLTRHQFFGLVLSLGAAIALSFTLTQ